MQQLIGKYDDITLVDISMQFIHQGQNDISRNNECKQIDPVNAISGTNFSFELKV